jgi:hypothetical protein
MRSERYGDWLFYGPMLLGALGSVLVALMRFLGVQQAAQAPPVLSRVREVIASIQEAGTLAELDAIRSDIDAAVAQLATNAESGTIDPHRTAMIALAVNHVDNVLAQRRDTLLREGSAASSGAGRIRAAE